MSRFISIIASLAIAGSLYSQDPDLTNYKSGIDMVFSGTKGTDYKEEYFYHDKAVTDVKVVYIKATTDITLSHNALNYAGNMHSAITWGGIIGVDGLDDIPDSGDEGDIRYKVDRDQQLGQWWSWAASAPTLVDAYTAPFAFEDLEYELGVPVVGTTGDNGLSHIVANKETYYWRGLVDSVGDEWHEIHYADDDEAWIGTADPLLVDDQEWWASDGKSCLFVVNPKTPCLTTKVTGNGQFYTTPPKVYFVPIIYDQTSYIYPRTGTVTIEIEDINGNNVFYRIVSDPEDVGTSYTDAGSSSVLLDDTDFSTGTEYLQYYYTGNQAYTKTRKVVKNPAHPSASETHGNIAWGNVAKWNDIQTRLARNPYLDAYNIVARNNTFNPVDDAYAEWALGQRSLYHIAWQNALAAKYEGLSAEHTSTRRFCDIAKKAILNNPRFINQLGHEISHTGSPIPSRELHYRGYFDVNSWIDSAMSYDILIDIFKESQDSEGITPIEDYLIRDMLGRSAHESLQWTAGWNEVDRSGMWDTARRIGGLIISYVLKSYNTEYYGTSGWEGDLTVYDWTPFPDDSNTWKAIFYDETNPINGYPNQDFIFGINDTNVVDGTGLWYDRTFYFGRSAMGHVMYDAMSMFAMNGVNKWPWLEQSFIRAFNGNFDSFKFALSYPLEEDQQFIHAPSVNSRLPDVAEIGLPVILGLDPGELELHRDLVPGLIWYEDDATEITPPNQNVRIITRNPVGFFE